MRINSSVLDSSRPQTTTSGPRVGCPPSACLLAAIVGHTVEHRLTAKAGCVLFGVVRPALFIASATSLSVSPGHAACATDASFWSLLHEVSRLQAFVTRRSRRICRHRERRLGPWPTPAPPCRGARSSCAPARPEPHRCATGPSSACGMVATSVLISSISAAIFDTCRDSRSSLATSNVALHAFGHRHGLGKLGRCRRRHCRCR